MFQNSLHFLLLNVKIFHFLGLRWQTFLFCCVSPFVRQHKSNNLTYHALVFALAKDSAQRREPP
jgi:hypothetical protein